MKILRLLIFLTTSAFLIGASSTKHPLPKSILIEENLFKGPAPPLPVDPSDLYNDTSDDFWALGFEEDLAEVQKMKFQEKATRERAENLANNWPSPTEKCAGKIRANIEQIVDVLKGIALKPEFIEQCEKATDRPDLCKQIIRPNPDSKSIFACTYPPGVASIFIPPEKGVWHFAFQAIRWISEIENLGISFSHIYNWLRPEPYNKNASGHPDRHPFGTAVDIKLRSKGDQHLAFEFFCEKWRSGQMNAIGFYSSASLHLGIGDTEKKEDLWIYDKQLKGLWFYEERREHTIQNLCPGIEG